MTNTRTPAKIIPRAFPGIKPEEVQEIITNSRIQSYPPETIVCRENEIENTFYMILEGDFEVSKVINNTEIRILKSLTAGDFFGEMALIHNAPRAATVKTKTNVIVLELNKEGFDRVLKHSPSVAMAMVSEISNRLRQNDQLAIDDLRLRASELADAYQKLAEQELMRREFLSNIAHELRTPLMVASGYLQAMKKGMLGSDQLNTAVDTIARNVDQITTLANDLLFLQEIELVLPEFQSVNLVEVTTEVIKRYESKAQARNVSIKMKGERGISNVRGDAQSISRAVTALIDNAIKFSAPRGEVEVRFIEQRERVLVSVEDRGIGISPEIRPRIFDRFFHLEKSGDELYSGLGIGLSITRQVILQHNGMLDVESQPGKGSKFTISLLKWQ
ncbi:MAG: cyclic nucleotide-binding domain-containing protein [Anaerolineales bacterium]|jgi:signal transduction histidine kinase|uniref:ATP-binding protein n=1 Tax=Candidatus Villigracilis affinis TaxID=3140682 RepID=UPI002A1F19E9|nr:cyclic nucleotide-binding domain-containing protein [Anaerolineales bacterium]MBL0347940.1 cyclic nucleotide-binding domain-containing protein [Anaerolineales bacterium]